MAMTSAEITAAIAEGKAAVDDNDWSTIKAGIASSTKGADVRKHIYAEAHAASLVVEEATEAMEDYPQLKADLADEVTRAELVDDCFGELLGESVTMASIANGTPANTGNAKAIRSTNSASITVGDTISIETNRPNSTGKTYRYGFYFYNSSGTMFYNTDFVLDSNTYTVGSSLSSAVSVKIAVVEYDGSSYSAIRTTDFEGYYVCIKVKTSSGVVYDLASEVSARQAADEALEATCDDLATGLAELYSMDSENLITSTNFRNGSTSTTVDKTNLTMETNFAKSSSTETIDITNKNSSIYYLTLDTEKTYIFHVRVRSGSSNTLSTGSIYAQLVNGTSYNNITNVSVFRISASMDSVIFGVFTPSVTSGYLRFVLDGLGSASANIHFVFDKIVCCEKTDGSSDIDIRKLIKELSNPVTAIKIRYRTPVDADIIAWGDSLTMGAGGSGTTWVGTCANQLALTYKNCGVGGESANTIACRQGGDNIIIPAGDVSGTYETLSDIFGATISPLLQGDGTEGGSAIIIDGQECALSYTSGTGYTISGYKGKAKTTPTVAEFIGGTYSGDVTVIWIGTNGATFPGYSTNVDSRIAIAESMIKHIDNNRYVVMGLSVGEGESTFYKNEENKMWQAFGNHYFPTRQLLCDYGLTIEGITPTEQDTTDLSTGTVPTSLRSDSTHMNQYGYEAIGILMAKKIRSLGFVD